MDKLIELPHSQKRKLIEFPKIDCWTKELLLNIQWTPFELEYNQLNSQFGWEYNQPTVCMNSSGGGMVQCFREQALESDAWDRAPVLPLPSLGDFGKSLNYFLPQFSKLYLLYRGCWGY